MIVSQNNDEKLKQFLESKALESIYPSPNKEAIKLKSKRPIHQKSADSQNLKLHDHYTTEDRPRLILAPTRWPYSVHGIVSFKLKGIHCWGTGTLIGPNIVLTAGYNIYNHTEKAYSDLESMQFLPGVNGHLLPFGVVEVEKYFVSTNYLQDEKREDFGILILKEPIGNETGYFGLACLEPEELESKRIHITGYPADKVASKPNTYEMWGMEGEAYDIDQERSTFSHCIETGPGQGGSGVWYQEGDDFYVCGVHLSGGQFANKATLLTRAIYGQIYQWIYEARNSQSFLQFNNIKELGFEDHQIDAKFLSRLAEYHLDQLAILRLSSKKIKSEGAKALAKNISWGNLSNLNLKNNEIDAQGMKALAQNKSWVNLSQLNLCVNNLKNKGAKALAQNTSWVQLSQLDLRANKIVNKGAKALAENIYWIHLSQLNLDENKIGDEGAKELAQNTSWITLSKLNLGGNKIGNKGIKALAQNTSWINLSELNLGRNKIGSEGVKELAQNTSWINLSQLNLCANKIQNKGAKALAQNRSWVNLSELNLDENKIDDEGAKGLAQNISWIKLSKLSLQKNDIGSEGANALARNLSWISFKSLNLTNHTLDA